MCRTGPIRLQQLSIPSGWTVCYNTFHDVVATLESVESNYTYFTEDLLQLHHAKYDYLIDLGWTPEGNYKEGSFHLQVYKGNFHGSQIYEHRSKDKDMIVAEIERLCLAIPNGSFPQ